jgi:hypothetical protein
VAEEANVECGCKSPLTEVHSKSNGGRGQIGWKNLKQNFKAHHRDSSESRQWAFSIPNIHSDDTEVLIMSRTFTHKTDESTLTTLCPRCLNAFRNTRGIRVRRADPYQLTKEPCTYCQTNFGYDYYIQPTSPKSTYTKKGRFDDELICA